MYTEKKKGKREKREREYNSPESANDGGKLFYLVRLTMEEREVAERGGLMWAWKQP